MEECFIWIQLVSTFDMFYCYFSGGYLAAVIAIQFVSSSVSDNVPCLQVLIYPVVQFFHFGRGAEQVLGVPKIFTFTLDENS